MSLGGQVLGTTTIRFEPRTYDSAFPLGATSASGVNVTADVAMRVAVVYACTTVISETLATVPLNMYEREGEDGKKRARSHELDEVLHDQPNRYQSAVEFREMMTAFALNRGRGIAEVTRSRSTSVAGRPTRPQIQVSPLHPDLITREVTDTGVVRYRYQDPVRRRERIILSDEAFVVSGRYGRSVLSYARDSFGVQLAAEAYVSSILRRGARPSGALKHPSKLDPKARDNLRLALDAYAIGGDNEGRPMLLEEGMSWQEIGLKHTDLEFVALRQFSVAEGCRWYRVPLHKVQELLRATNNNIERQSIDYVQDSILPWAVRWEQAIRRDLITRPDVFFAEHNLEGLLRGDIKTRFQAYAIAVQWGWMSRNEVREKENLNRREGLDEVLTPSNMTVGEAGEPRNITFLRPGDEPKAEVVHYLRAMVRDGASRLVRKETAKLAALAERTNGEGEAWTTGVKSFYAEHGPFVATVLKLPDEVAEGYAAGRCERLLELGPAAMDEPENSAIAELTELALTRADVLRLPAEAAA